MRMRMLPTNRRSKLKFFRYLQSEVVIDILSRLPIGAIAVCKCVCKSWRDLLRTRHLADFYLPKSVPVLVIGAATLYWGPNDLSFFEVNDELGLQHHHLHYKPLTRIDSVQLATFSVLEGSANGLILLRKRDAMKGIVLYICNPFTREYIELSGDCLVESSYATHVYGFGLSRMTRQYKVVRIFDEWKGASICLVYLLGIGIWRSITPPAAQFRYNECPTVGYLNGNLHWLVQVSDSSHCISCFDLETESFSTFPIPSRLRKTSVLSLVVLGDCLCVSDATHEDDVVIWLMKEYGDEKSWTKEFVVRQSRDLNLSCHDFDGCFVESAYVHPLKVFKDGDILMAWQNQHMFYYSKKTFLSKGADQVFRGNASDLSGMKAMLHIPSFFSLGSFVNERVSRF